MIKNGRLALVIIVGKNKTSRQVSLTGCHVFKNSGFVKAQSTYNDCLIRPIAAILFSDNLIAASWLVILSSPANVRIFVQVV